MNHKSSTTMRWKEPPAFRQSQLARSAHAYRWYRPLFMLGICVLGLGGALFHQNPVGGSWPLTVALIVGIGFLVAYGLPLIALMDPNVIFVGERGIGRQSNMASGARLECWPWQDIEQCTVSLREIEGRSFRILSIHLSDGELVELALGDRVDLAELASVLEARGCALEQSTSSGL